MIVYTAKRIRNQRTFRRLSILIVIWLALIASFVYAGLLHETGPGPATQAPALWPAGSKLHRCATGSTLLMFLHPQCPCSRASLKELYKMVAQCQTPPEVLIVFYKPERAPIDWLHTDKWALANCIPHSSAVIDSGNEAQLFDAKTSGHTLIYNNAGQLIFAGGITGSRGHEGDNFGLAQALIALKSNSRSLNTSPPTFGCLLH